MPIFPVGVPNIQAIPPSVGATPSQAAAIPDLCDGNSLGNNINGPIWSNGYTYIIYIYYINDIHDIHDINDIYINVYIYILLDILVNIRYILHL